MAKSWRIGPLPDSVRERDYHSGRETIALPREGAGGFHRVFGTALLFGPFFLQLLPLPLALQCLFPLLDIQFFCGAGVLPETQGFCELAGKCYRTPITVVVELVFGLNVDDPLPVLDLIGESRHCGPPRGSGCVGDRPTLRCRRPDGVSFRRRSFTQVFGYIVRLQPFQRHDCDPAGCLVRGFRRECLPRGHPGRRFRRRPCGSVVRAESAHLGGGQPIRLAPDLSRRRFPRKCKRWPSARAISTR